MLTRVMADEIGELPALLDQVAAGQPGDLALEIGDAEQLRCAPRSLLSALTVSL